MNKSLYDTLGVSQNASSDDIKKAYRKLARQYHPDINKQKDAEEKFKEINAAYEILSDENKRAQYNQFGDSMFGGQNFSDFARSNQNVNIDDILASIFGNTKGGFSGGNFGGFGGFGGFGNFGGFDSSTLDINDQITIPFESALLGGSYHYNNNGLEFDIKIPAGIKNNETLRIANKGKKAQGQTGNLLLKVVIAPSNEYEIKDNVLHKIIDIPLKIAIFGGKVKVNTPYKEVTLTIPKNTKNNQKMRIKEQGIKDRKTSKIGDLLLIINVILPSCDTIDKELAKLMQEKLPE